MARLTVSAGVVRELLNLAVVKGADRAELAARAGLSLADLEDQDNRIGFTRYIDLMRAAKTACNDPALALHFGETSDFAKMSIVGLIGLASETMAEAFAQLNRYGRLVVEFDGGPDRFKMIPGREGMWMVDTRENPNEFYELTESTFARMICGPRVFGIMQLAQAVHVTHKAPGYAAEYERVYGAPVTFGSDRNAILLDESLGTHRIQVAPRYAFGILSEHADALLKSLENSKSTRGRVEALLMPVLHTGDANIDAVASKLGLSRQTLFRKLKTEGTTFEKVLDALRHKLAVDYLRGEKTSVNETAYLVGFSDPSAFSRAFKRWTGKSPRAMRRAG